MRMGGQVECKWVVKSMQLRIPGLNGESDQSKQLLEFIDSRPSSARYLPDFHPRHEAA